MANYLDDNIKQSVFLDFNFLEILGEKTFEYSLYRLITERLDLSEFDRRYKNKNVGRKAYPPALLLRVIFYAYYRGITSSRVIERSCQTDLKFMALAAGKRPHFTTIADFVSSNSNAMSALFHKVLLICCKSNLVGKEHFAIDGCKLPSDASKAWSGTHKDLQKKSDKLRKSAQKIIDRHLSTDNSKNDGDKTRELRTMDTLLKNAEKIDEFLATNEKRMGKGRRPEEVQSNITDNDSTKMTTSTKGTIQGFNCQTASDQKYQVVIAAEAFGVGQDQSTLQPMVEAIRNNLRDEGDVLKTVLLTADTGYSSEANMQYLFEEGINAVVPDTHFRQRDQRIVESETYQKHKAHRRKTRQDKRQGTAVIPATEFVFNRATNTCVCPAGNEMLVLGERKRERGVYARFRGKLKDCRACPLQTQCMKHPLKIQGRQVSFLLEGREEPSYLDLMKQKIDSEQGRKNYARRMWTIEPVFGNITSNKGLDRISLRGKVKATTQWLMYCMVHNMEKLWRYA